MLLSGLGCRHSLSGHLAVHAGHDGVDGGDVDVRQALYQGRYMEYGPSVFTQNTAVRTLDSVRLSIVYLHSIQLSNINNDLIYRLCCYDRTIVLTDMGQSDFRYCH